MTNTNQSIRFQGKKYILVPCPELGEVSKNGDIYTKHQYEQQLRCSAILRDGVVWRNHKVIGFKRHIKVLGDDNTQIMVGPCVRMVRQVEAMEGMFDPLAQLVRQMAMEEHDAENQAKIKAEEAKSNGLA